MAGCHALSQHDVGKTEAHVMLRQRLRGLPSSTDAPASYCTMRFLLLSLVPCVLTACQALSTSSCSPKTYPYLAIGSNMLSSTMENLRGITDYEATPAVLCDYRLAFNVLGSPLLEPAAAAACPCSGSKLHGVLYYLTEKDFARVGSTEGIPWTYHWKSCRVYPYKGNGGDAGRQAVARDEAVDAFVLVATCPSWKDHIPPSSSYLGILQKGAKEFHLDLDYQHFLGQVTVARNLVVPDGLSGRLLHAAELISGRKRTQK